MQAEAPASNASSGFSAEEDALINTTLKFNEYVKDWWRIIYGATRHGFRQSSMEARKQRTRGLQHFYWSAELYDWIILVAVLVVFFVMYRWLVHLPSKRPWHSLVILFWFGMAVLYAFLILFRQGRELAVQWGCGYVLEFIFLIENVFVYQIIIGTFKLPRPVNENALYIVVVFTVIFQMVFYMGLASMLTQWGALHYILGVWLVFVAYQAAMEDDHVEVDIGSSRVVKLAQLCFGSRLSLAHSDGSCMVAWRDGRWTLTLSGLMVFCLLLADFLLEIDVTLAKIEEIGGVAPQLEYICFSSSALATFTVPELFFVVRDLFERFRLLKYGIALVVAYLGVGMLLARVFPLNALLNIVIFLAVLIFSMVISFVMDEARQSKEAETCWEGQVKEDASGGAHAGISSFRPLTKATQDAIKNRSYCL